MPNILERIFSGESVRGMGGVEALTDVQRGAGTGGIMGQALTFEAYQAQKQAIQELFATAGGAGRLTVGGEPAGMEDIISGIRGRIPAGAEITPAAPTARTGFVTVTPEFAALPIAQKAGLQGMVNKEVPTSWIREALGFARDTEEAAVASTKLNWTYQKQKRAILESVYDRRFGKGGRPRKTEDFEEVVRELQAGGATEADYPVLWKRAKIKVKNPAGEVGYIFQSKWGEAKRAGYEKVK